MLLLVMVILGLVHWEDNYCSFSERLSLFWKIVSFHNYPLYHGYLCDCHNTLHHNARTGLANTDKLCMLGQIEYFLLFLIWKWTTMCCHVICWKLTWNIHVNCPQVLSKGNNSIWFCITIFDTLLQAHTKLYCQTFMQLLLWSLAVSGASLIWPLLYRHLHFWQ